MAASTETSRTRTRVAVVASLTFSLVNFRLELLRSLVRSGCDVYALAPDDDPESIALLEEAGVHFRQISMDRTGTGLLADIRTLRTIKAAFDGIRPDIVLPYTMKPVIYAGLAARMVGIPKRYALITGLGYVFTGDNPSFRKKLLRQACVFLYRHALKGAVQVFIYNNTDAEIFRSLHIVTNSNSMLVPGSGIDTRHFSQAPPPDGPPVFLLIARLLKDKGIREYVEAARILRARHPQARVQLLGPFDPNPAAIARKEVEEWTANGTIEYLGEAKDVRPYLRSCSVLVLPSYREGIPRTVLEAMSTGRAVVTTDAPGCVDTVEDGETGFIVPVADAAALAQAMEKFVTTPSSIVEMGKRARQCAVERYDVHVVNRILIEEMGLQYIPPANSNREAAC
ncbi:glycosyltransferase [Stappia sp. GBMRC 2046]|uniref:Glycosyltransferase n=1 Tax=Stappia sediminis TaxID=2692190 RepID=A0A7X3LYL8_9HYPH|nr:glycosyltransferase family 4 protein [Stappia sediminis]MXN67466.1 glycosyltransferase [Stappia sediminis]